jgi:iduronate 2-sulfatase
MRSIPLRTILLFIMAILALGARAADAKRNVLLIISDDLNVALGCYGHPLARTPNIDALAARSVRFEHAYCQFPLCNPSRCSFMTGRRPDTTKVYDNGVNFRLNLPDVVTIPQHFQKSGYFAARVGKIYHYGVPNQIGTNGMDDGGSWNQVINPRGRDKDEEADVINFTPNRQIGGALSWLQTKGDGEDHTDAKIAEAVVGLLDQHKDGPFFIACGFFRPHVPCAASENYFNLYPLDSIKLPQEPPEHIAAIPKIALTCQPLNYGVEPQNLKLMTRAYHASTSLMDTQVGKVLAAVDRLKLADHTIVVFMSDHGWCLGEHGQWQKMLLFEESVHVPLMIYDPSGPNHGKVSTHPVELVDLYATLADLAGLPDPQGVEGPSLRPLLENPSAAWDQPARSQVYRAGQKVMGRSIRTEKWRYIEWDDAGKRGVELYDHETDPKEYQNLAIDPKHAQTVERMKALMAKP